MWQSEYQQAGSSKQQALAMVNATYASLVLVLATVKFSC